MMRGGADRRQGGLLSTLIPWRNFDMTDSAERHAYVNNLLDSRIGRVLNWLPFILVMALACSNVQAAVWSAFGVQVFVILLKLYQFTANRRQSPVMWLDAGLALALLGQGIAAEVTALPCHIIGPINVSVILASALASMAACSPFTMQFARLKPELTDEVLASAEFLKLNYVLTSIWVGLFALMAVSSWLGWAFFSDNTSSAGYIALSIVVPIVLPVLGVFIMPFVVDCLRKRGNRGASSKRPADASREDLPIAKTAEDGAVDDGRAEAVIEEGYFAQEIYDQREPLLRA